ncbi:MAG: hypothetical protein VX519_01800 [Myxococcota bacterium]|nr:hypothetical protein [Myxococcota bacterium]
MYTHQMRFNPAVFLLLGACSCNGGKATQEQGQPPASSGEVSTKEALPIGGDASPEATSSGLAWLVLHDVQGLYGGRALYLRPDGSVVVQVVAVEEAGLVDRHFETSLDDEARAGIAKLLEEHDFQKMLVESRPGIPDEARAVIAVGYGDGGQHSVAKWAGVSHEGFTALYGHLVSIADKAATGEPIYTGAFDYNWRPDGADWSSLD